MGIYDQKRKWDFGFKFEIKKLKFPLIALVLVIVIILISFFAASWLKANAIQYSFSDNPLDLSDNNSTLLSVTVYNTLDKDLTELELEVKPRDEKSLIVFNSIRDIPVLGKGESRKFELGNAFLIQPSPTAEIVSGDYAIDIYFRTPDRNFTTTATLTIKS